MFAIGDIVKIFAPQAGHVKYHLCVCVDDSNNVAKFLYLNSESGFDGDYIVKCERVPCIPPSYSGISVFSFSIIIRYTAKQAKLYNAKIIGKLEPGLAKELADFAATVKTLNASDRAMVLAALSILSRG